MEKFNYTDFGLTCVHSSVFSCIQCMHNQKWLPINFILHSLYITVLILLLLYQQIIVTVTILTANGNVIIHLLYWCIVVLPAEAYFAAVQVCECNYQCSAQTM